tara:strand:- start:924 stop:1205 length:282 start_codon:yes stop_codon:yes gene_type:complete
VRHRDAYISLAEKGLYLAIHFPHDDPPGWCWGKPLSSGRTSKDSFWVNFTAAGEDYEVSDDVKVNISALTAENYKKTWAVVAPNDFKEHDEVR